MKNKKKEWSCGIDFFLSCPQFLTRFFLEKKHQLGLFSWKKVVYRSFWTKKKHNWLLKNECYRTKLCSTNIDPFPENCTPTLFFPFFRKWEKKRFLKKRAQAPAPFLLLTTRNTVQKKKKKISRSGRNLFLYFLKKKKKNPTKNWITTLFFIISKLNCPKLKEKWIK